MEKTTGRAMQPPMYSGQDPNSFNQLPSLLDLCRKHNISPFFASQLHIMKEYVAVRIIVDDSGSMKTTVTDAFGRPNGTRWDELLRTLESVFDIACASAGTSASSVTPNTPSTAGISVYFLNGHDDGRKQFNNLQSFAELRPVLAGLPVRGRTPTAECLQDVFHPEIMQDIGELPVLTILFTDGVPDCGIDAMANLLNQIQMQCTNSFITISLCTEDDSVVSRYNRLDATIPRLDVMDDYKSEKREVMDVQGRRFAFSKSDYLVKMLLGPRVSLWDSLDERKLSKPQRKMFEDYSRAAFGTSGKNSDGSCVIC